MSEENDPVAPSEEPPTSVEGPDDTATSKSRIPTVLIAIATVLGVFSVLAVWVRTQALDTDEWVRLSDQLLEEEEVSEAIAGYLVDQLYERADLSADLDERLPDSLGDVASVLAGALRGPVTDGVERFISSDRFRSAWVSVNRAAHSTFVAIVRDDTPPGLSSADGVVALELRELLLVVGDSLGFSGERLENLPDDAGRVVIFESDELDSLQQSVRLLDVLSWVLFVLVVGLYAVAVALARGRRVATLQRVGIALVGAGVFVLLLRSVGVRIVVNWLVEDPTVEPLAAVIASTATSLIRQMAWTAIAWGAVVALFAGLLGGHRIAVRIRRLLAPAVGGSPAAVAGVTVVVVLAVVVVSPDRALEGLLSGLVTLALIIGGVVALRRQVAIDASGDVSAETLGEGIDESAAERTLS